MAEYSDENTLFKAKDVLTDMGLENDFSETIIKNLLDAGFLFRELETAQQASKRIIEEVTGDFAYLPSISKDEQIRLECLHMATSTIPLNRTGNESQFIERARYFEQYVCNGAFEGANNG